jgi:trans-aconitate methyltransferase
MTHEFDGKRYEKASAHQREWGSRIIREFNLTGAEHILDLGCGDGALTARLAELVPEGMVLGIDASHGMIDTASSRERSNLRFRRLDINEMAFEGQFDLVFSNAALHWVKDHKSLLQNVYRALRPGGRIRFNFAGNGNCSNFFTVVREAMALAEYSPGFAGFEWPWYVPTVEEYTGLAESSGLREVHVWGEIADRFFPDAEAVTRWIDQPSLMPFLAYVAAPARSSFRDLVVDRMIERTKEKDGRCFETFRRINVSAMK